MPGVLPIVGKPGSVRIAKSVPRFSYANGSQPDLSLIGRFMDEDDDRSSQDFPSPSALLGTTITMEDAFDYDLIEGVDSPLAFEHDHDHDQNGSGFLRAVQATPDAIVSSSFEDGAFDYNAFENASHSHPSSSSGNKRPAPSSPLQSEPAVKFRRVLPGEDGEVELAHVEMQMEVREGEKEGEAKQVLPEWTNEFDAELVAYFAEFAEFK
jgi:hypothetical protein